MFEKEKILTILKDIQEEDDFQQFFNKFIELKNKAENEEKLQQMDKESDRGNCEYKLKFDKPTMDRVEHLQTQMRYRLNEGHGHAKYRIGINDNGLVEGISIDEMKDTLSVLFYMARNQDAKIEIQ